MKSILLWFVILLAQCITYLLGLILVFGFVYNIWPTKKYAVPGITVQKIISVKPGMRIQEVIDILGKPYSLKRDTFFSTRMARITLDENAVTHLSQYAGNIDSVLCYLHTNKNYYQPEKEENDPTDNIFLSYTKPVEGGYIYPMLSVSVDTNFIVKAVSVKEYNWLDDPCIYITYIDYEGDTVKSDGKGLERYFPH